MHDEAGRDSSSHEHDRNDRCISLFFLYKTEERFRFGRMREIGFRSKMCALQRSGSLIIKLFYPPVNHLPSFIGQRRSSFFFSVNEFDAKGSFAGCYAPSLRCRRVWRHLLFHVHSSH